MCPSATLIQVLEATFPPSCSPPPQAPSTSSYHHRGGILDSWGYQERRPSRGSWLSGLLAACGEPKTSPRSLESHFGAVVEPFWSHVGVILELFCAIFYIDIDIHIDIDIDTDIDTS